MHDSPKKKIHPQKGKIIQHSKKIFFHKHYYHLLINNKRKKKNPHLTPPSPSPFVFCIFFSQPPPTSLPHLQTPTYYLYHRKITPQPCGLYYIICNKYIHRVSVCTYKWGPHLFPCPIPQPPIPYQSHVGKKSGKKIYK